MASVPNGTRAVLITGAGKGIGEATARYLASHDFRVFAGVRSADDARRIAEGLDGRLTPVQLDVTDPTSIHAAVASVAAERPFRFLGLVNNSAISTPCPLELLPSEALRELFEVNVFGVMALTRALLPELRRADVARIVNVSSINGRLAQPFIGGYSATKFALEAISDALRRELRPWGIGVTVVQPGAVATPIFDTARQRGRDLAVRIPEEDRRLYPGVMQAVLDRPGKPPRHAIPPTDVARVIARALRRRRLRTRYLVGRDARLGALLAAVLPDRLLDWLLTNRMTAS
jgi:NAD(P)-dependent dehydrogenase (short-subunit alcohol dehydrogenase family)